MNTRGLSQSFIMTILIILLAACTKEPTPKKVIRPVRYEAVSNAGTVQTQSFSGVSQAGTEARMSFRVSGTVIKVNVKVGDTIKKGARIASMDQTDERLTLEKAQVAQERSRIQKETAKSNLGRIRTLYEDNNVSLSEYEAAKNSYASAKAEFNAGSKTLELQKRVLNYYTLIAPMDGIVIRVEVDANENIQAGQIVAVINADDEIEVTAGIPESYISKIRSGDVVTVKFSSIKDKIYEGTVSEVSFTLSDQTFTYPITVKLDTPATGIRPGMPATVTFSFNQADATNILIIPAHAVGEDSAGNFVFTVTATTDDFGIVNRREVTVGKLTGDGFQILSGLNNGELVVTAGISMLSDGLKVRMLK